MTLWPPTRAHRHGPSVAMAAWLAAGAADLGMTLWAVGSGAASEAMPTSAVAWLAGGALGFALWKIAMMTATWLVIRWLGEPRLWWIAAVVAALPVIAGLWQLAAPLPL